MKGTDTRLTFFRQSGWMVLAVTASGVFMYAVHIPALARMPEAEYGVFTTLLQVLNLMLIPSLGLQTVFTQQAASALTGDEQGELRGAVRTILRWAFVFWAATAAVVFLWQGAVLAALKIQNPAALWVTVATGLPMLWLPIMLGLLQGSQNFLWLGWAAILNGVGRFLTVIVTVVLLGGYAAGGMVGPLLGMTIALAAGLWQTRKIWAGLTRPFCWPPWLARVLPLTLGLGTSQFMLAADMIAVQAFFAEDTGRYGAVGTIARGIVIFTGPLTMVMFPKIVRSAALSEDTDVLKQALLATGFLGAMAALGCALLPQLPFQVMNKPSYLPIAPLLPWFAWCMLPLTLSNVLVNNLLARSQFKAVPWLALVVLAYGAALVGVGKFGKTGDLMRDFQLIVKTLGVFNLLFLGVSVWWTFAGKTRRGKSTPTLE